MKLYLTLVFFYCIAVTIAQSPSCDCSSPFADKTSSKYLSLKFGECIGQGYKNIVVNLEGNVGLIARIGFIHDGNSVLSYRNSTDLTTFESALIEWRSSSGNGLFLADVLDQVTNNPTLSKDIVPRQHIENEVTFERWAQTGPQLVFQIVGTLHRVIIPLPPSQYIRGNISVVVEYNLQMAGDIRSLNDGDFTEQNLLLLLLGVYNDQLTFNTSVGMFHYDGHPGNILYNRGKSGELYFMWSDFGKTSAASSVANQFRNSISAISNLVHSKSMNFPTIRDIVDKLLNVSLNYDLEFITSDNGLPMLKKTIESSILESYDRSAVLMSPTLKFGVEYLSSRISILEADVSDLKQDVSELKAENIAQAEQLKSQAEQLKSQADRIYVLEDQITRFLNIIESQNSKIEDLSTRLLAFASKPRNSSVVDESFVGDSHNNHTDDL